MKRIIGSIFIIVMIFMVHINVLADNKCTSDEMQRLKKLASNVEVRYEYKIDDVKVGNVMYKEPAFSIIASNLNKDLLVMIIEDEYADKYREFKSNTGSYTLDGFKSGDKVQITIKAFVPNACSGQVLSKTTINLPYYNLFASNELCQKYPEFKYCVEWLDKPIERNVFNREINEYINVLNKGKDIDKGDFNNRTLYFIIGGIVGIIIIIILGIVIVKRKKNNAL